MCARLEGSGKANRIHCSRATMDLLVAAGRGAWVHSREEKVHLKGIGEVETFWINPKGRDGGSVASVASRTSNGSSPEMSELAKSTARLVDWNVEVLFSLLENVQAHREATKKKPDSRSEIARAEHEMMQAMEGKIVIDEMTQILEMAEFSEAAVLNKKPFQIDLKVKQQLHDFVTTIAGLYRDVPFHNFAHASHVIMSAEKLMKRIMKPEGIDYEQINTCENKEVAVAREIHKATYGMSSDPLMQFAVVWSALIHDAAHTGLTNAELNNMNSELSEKYRRKSVAEQNSVELAWSILMDDRFNDLRACIYTTKAELHRFRQLLVNAVMATGTLLLLGSMDSFLFCLLSLSNQNFSPISSADIADKELKQLREKRWDDAFSERATDCWKKDIDRRATITFEYIIQASDIAHTMQHWLTYQKFNARLFEERYLAWVNGHAGEKNPAVGWPGGEIWFFGTSRFLAVF
jgi:hypothetical protein